MPKSYTPELHRRVIELLSAGSPDGAIAGDLGISEATIYRWVAQRKTTWASVHLIADIHHASMGTYGGVRPFPTHDGDAEVGAQSARRLGINGPTSTPTGDRGSKAAHELPRRRSLTIRLQGI